MMTAVIMAMVIATLTTSTFATTPDNQFSITETNKGKRYKPGELVFADEFDTLDCETWVHELTLGGSDRWEFQIYENSRKTSFVRDGIIFIKPRPTSEEYDIERSEVDMNTAAPAEPCTNPSFYGCWRRGSWDNILNPIISAQLRTRSFSFQYGRVEMKAKLPGGDWMWPSFKLWARRNKYGVGAASGQISVLESRGNQQLYEPDGSNVGSQMITQGLFFGPTTGVKSVINTARTSQEDGFDQDFHLFGLEWTPHRIAFSVDNTTTNVVTPSEKGFADIGGFTQPDDIPWIHSDNMRIAPFDHKFFLLVNVAVGGVSGYFGDHLKNTKGPKPWSNSGGKAASHFWNAKDQWIPTWAGDNGTLQIDYIRVYAI